MTGGYGHRPAAIRASTLEAQSVIAAIADDTPIALTVAEQRIVGRKTGGNVDDLTAGEARAILNVADGADVTSSNPPQAHAASHISGGDQIATMAGDAGAGGTTGLVPAPAAGDAAKYLKGDGTWATVSAGIAGPGSSTDYAVALWDGAGGATIRGSGLTVTTGTYSAQTWTRLLMTAANDDLVLSPTGTGALYLGPPADGSVTGGNQRGSCAVDLQLSRNGATQIASGAQSVVIGGTKNTASFTNSGCFAGDSNSATNAASATAGGAAVTASGAASFCGGGNTCTASADYSATLGGANNWCNGTHTAILGGDYNDTGANHAACIAGKYGYASALGSVTMGYAAQADHPCSVAFSGNSESLSDAQRGKSQGQLVHIDQRTTNDTPTAMDSAGTELAIPSNHAFTYFGTCTAWNETGTNVTSWAVQGTIKNPGGTPTLLGNTQTLIIDEVGGGGVITLVPTAVAGATDYLRWTVTGIAATNIRWSLALTISRAGT